MPRLPKDCPLCGKQGLSKLSNHLADYYHLTIKDRRPFLMQAKTFPFDCIFKEIKTLKDKHYK